MQLALMVAMARNGCIGRNNRLPWYLPNELKYFRQVTMGKPIIMGRRTWESLKKPLPGRTNIVVTTRKDYHAEGAKVVGGLRQAIELAENVAYIDGAEEAVIIGGALLYAEALAKVDRMYVTEVHAEVSGDTFFPAFDRSAFREVARESCHAEPPNEYDYSMVVYERV